MLNIPLLAAAQQKTFIKRLAEKPVLPLVGFNKYDGFMLGAGVQNFLKKKTFQYYAAPAFAFRSTKLLGYAGARYSLHKFAFGVDLARFSTLDGRDSSGNRIFTSMQKFAPYVRLNLKGYNNYKRWLELRSYNIAERDFSYILSISDSTYHPSNAKRKWRYLNQIAFNGDNERELFPYSYMLQLQQASSFYRVNAELFYFFNYLNKGGVQLRLFAAKFGYLGDKTDAKKYETARFQPKLTAVRGNEDYTYGNYFGGRNEFDGFLSQQIMMRDGGLKLRTDIFQDLQGRSDNWIASINLNTTVLPEIPLRIFLDAGTYAALWSRESEESRLLYVAGLQLSVLKNLINIYAPLVYSKKFREQLSTVPSENKFGKRISFSIDIQKLKWPQRG